MSFRDSEEEPRLYGAAGLIGDGSAMQAVRAQVRSVALDETPVLITGETGTGKEVVAHAVHAESNRRHQKFSAINCAAIADHLVFSELFGHEAGAFTGATGRRLGAFRSIDGGTLLLDEIGDLRAESQAALLRVLETGEVQPVGCDAPVRVNVRVLAATNRDLASRNTGPEQFRSDLYYRLCGDCIELPPLRDRLEDLAVLSTHLLLQCARPRPVVPPLIAASALNALAEHHWDGNVRELGHVIRRCWRESDWAEVLEAEDVARVLPASRRVHADRPGRPLRASHRSHSTARRQTSPLIPAGFNPRCRASPNKLAVFRRVLAHVGGDPQAAADLIGITGDSFVRSLADLERRLGNSASRA